jgi:glycosyltransferase involved in cell wall biosynthesis
MSVSPAITVLLASYNDARFLPEAVASILAQDCGDFEFIIVDDGSTDGSAEYLSGISDSRVRVLRNQCNQGLAASLNRGLSAARGQYLARMDADDIADSQRLGLQLDFLRRNRDIGIVGSSRTLINEAGDFIAHAPAVAADLHIRWKCLLGNPFAHPTVMIRRSVLIEHRLVYRDVYRAEDYDLWPRLLAHTRGANLEQPLLKYRIRPRGALASAAQLQTHDQIANQCIQTLVPGFAIAPEEVTELRGRFGGYSVRDPSMDPHDPHWLQRRDALLQAFSRRYAGADGLVEWANAQRSTHRPAA